jgi:hypothetical protein
MMRLLKKLFGASVKHANGPVFFPILKSIATTKSPARSGNAGSTLPKGSVSAMRKE